MDRAAVETTPQVWIDGRRVGGYDDLRRYFDMPVKDPKATSYRPVVALFVMAALLALAWRVSAHETALGPMAHPVAQFIATAMCLLAMLKLRDVESFSTMFLGYDLLARRWVPYASIYPYAEALAGLLMLAQVGSWLAIPTSLFIGGVGAVSVFKAVYIDCRELRCACMGGDSSVPLGFISLTENLMMVGMAGWMLLAQL